MTTVIWAVLAAALLLVEHMIFRDRQWRLTRVQSYIVGVATLVLCFTGWAASTNNGQSAIALWVIAGAGGATVVIAYWIEERIASVRSDSQLSGVTAAHAEQAGDGIQDG